MIMTIDEAIKDFKDDAENNRVDLDLEFAKKNEQLAEWLEELKAYREQHQALCDAYDVNTVEDIYDKAIDDFIKAVDKQCGYYAGECKNLTRDDLLKIAKELKDNG
jgi:hypothetical protein